MPGHRLTLVGALTCTVLAVGCGVEAADAITAAPTDAGQDATNDQDAASPDSDARSDAPALDVRTDEATTDSASPPVGDGGDASNLGTTLVLGSDLTLLGVTSQGMVIYSDGTSYSGVSVNGGPPTVIVPVTGLDQVAVEGPYAFFWGAHAYMHLATGCPTCAGQFAVDPWGNDGLTPDHAPIVSQDGNYFAFTVSTPDASAGVSLWEGSSIHSFAGPIVQNAPCVKAFELTSNDDLVATLCSEGDAGPIVVREVFQGGWSQPELSEVLSSPGTVDSSILEATASDGNWLFSVPFPLGRGDAGVRASGVITHVPDGATHLVAPIPGFGFEYFTFDPAGTYFYFSAIQSATYRVSTNDLSVTTVTPSFCLPSFSPDGTAIACGNQLISLQTGAVTPLPISYQVGSPGITAPVGFTDDWSFIYGTTTFGLDGGVTPQDPDAGYLYRVWVQPVGGTVETPLGSAQDLDLLSVTSLSTSTLLVRNGSAARVFDATGATPPQLVTGTVAPTRSAWALSPDRKAGVYVSVAAPAGLYVVPLP